MAESQPGGEPRRPQSPDDALPAVQPPSATFILQLFFIPLLIVAIIVCVWMAFSWMAHVGNDPHDLVRDLRRLNDNSWQKAMNLANLLRNQEYDHLKDDVKLAGELASLLEDEIKAGKNDEARLRLRIFLCRALGEFRIDTGVPTLVHAAVEQREPAEVNVRAAAVEAIAVLAEKLGEQPFRENEKLMQALGKAAACRSDSPDEKHLCEQLRSRAAFALGVVGGAEALEQLGRLQDDAYANARFNAATGLARHGDLRAKNVLLEMLDPRSESVVVDEKSPSEREAKRLRVFHAALEAVSDLWKKATSEQRIELAELKTAVEKLADGGTSGRVQSRAKEVALQLAAS